MLLILLMQCRVEKKSAFTLVELLVAVTLISIAMFSTFWALTQANQNASIARLQTGAAVAAQNRIDLILSDSPFNPQNGQIPPELTPGTVTETGVAVYTDPVSGDTVTGTRTTDVANLGVIVSGINMNIYRATVKVSYQYRNRSYSVTLNTLRTSDI